MLSRGKGRMDDVAAMDLELEERSRPFFCKLRVEWYRGVPARARAPAPGARTAVPRRRSLDGARRTDM
jgi:hypothetical protein